MDKLPGLSVLLVEDEFLIALDAEQILKDLGAASVKTVASYQEAEKESACGTYGLAILDVNLNGKLSFPIGETLRNRGVPVVFATGYDLAGRPGAPGCSRAPCVVKPYSASRLREAIRAALDGEPLPTSTFLCEARSATGD